MAHRKLRGSAAVLAHVALLGGCGYLEQRLEDAGDMVFASIGTGFGLSASGFISPFEVVGGYGTSNVYGWEGRRTFHRRETTWGLPVLLFNRAWQEEADGGSWWNLPRTGIPPRGPQPYLWMLRKGGFGLGHEALDLPIAELSPEAPIRAEAPSGWGVGVAATPGFFSVRLGVRPFGVVNFLTGWFGFHLLPPYKAFSNEIDPEHLRDRGILWPMAGKDPVRAIVSDLGHPTTVVRAHSAKTLGLMGAAAREHIEALRPLTTDPEVRVRVHAIVALHRIDPEALDARAALAGDPDSHDYPAFVEAAMEILSSASGRQQPSELSQPSGSSWRGSRSTPQGSGGAGGGGGGPPPNR